jgi:hypothetical protein
MGTQNMSMVKMPATYSLFIINCAISAHSSNYLLTTSIFAFSVSWK